MKFLKKLLLSSCSLALSLSLVSALHASYNGKEEVEDVSSAISALSTSSHNNPEIYVEGQAITIADLPHEILERFVDLNDLVTCSRLARVDQYFHRLFTLFNDTHIKPSDNRLGLSELYAEAREYFRNDRLNLIFCLKNFSEQHTIEDFSEFLKTLFNKDYYEYKSEFKQNLNIHHSFNNELKVIPRALFTKTYLSTICLMNNKLIFLPKEINWLANLTALYFDTNRLTTLPVEISELVNLRILSLIKNQLTELPAEIGKLINLTHLSLTSNQLTMLPAEIGKLKNLELLFLNSNQLLTLPAEIVELSENIFELDLSYNQLTVLPEEFSALKNLNHLNLSYNQLTMLPRDIGNLTRLNYLLLNDNKLMQLPLSFCNFLNLQQLSLNNNSYKFTQRDLISLMGRQIKFMNL